ncbi:MAG: hypothetical protein AB7G28_12250 [Pirellulales bacterium]
MLASTAILSALVVASALGQELTTNAERDWKAIRNSDDTRTKLMAERWFNAVKQQEWSDTSGKFKVSAKYLEHDPNLAWVKLRVFRGTGKERVVKDVQIPLDKLSKSCQARVRTISVLAEKVAEAKEEEAKKEKEDEENGESPEGRRGSARGERPAEQDEMPEEAPGDRGRFDAGLAGMDPREVVERSEPAPGGRGDQSPAATNNGPPLPALMPGLPTTAAATPAAATLPAAQGMAADSAGSEAWRTNYEAFRANIKVQKRGSEMYSFEWGPMTAFGNAYQTNKRWEEYGSVGPEQMAEITAALTAIGEVQWEATLQQDPPTDGDWTAALAMPPLPEPWEFSYVLDTKNDPGPWQQLKAGDRVRFTGRFDGFDETYGIVLAIRFPAAATGESAAAAMPAGPATADPATATAEAPPLSDIPNLIDNDPWRLDYEAFRTVFAKDETGIISTRERWPGVINLQLFTPAEFLQGEQGGAEPTYVAVPRLVEVGDFLWEGTIAQQPTADANWADVLQLAPLPEPLKLELRLQDGGRAGNWQQLQVGEHVRFVGRFVGYRGPYGWVAEIRILPLENLRR